MYSSSRLLLSARAYLLLCVPVCRCIAVHPTLPVFLTCSDDTLIKLWDWEKVRRLQH